MKQVVIFTDGACRGNPGIGAYAARLEYQGHQKMVAQAYELTTNNRMELMAMIKGLEMLKEPCAVTAFTDSKYVQNAITEGWLKRWAANGWRPKWKSPKLVKNVDLWKILHTLLEKHDVTVEWVKGHAGNEGNEAVDQVANEAIDSGNFLQDEGFLNKETHLNNPNQMDLGL